MNYDKLVDLDKCHKDAERLVKAGEGRWGTDEETFNVLFSIRDIYHLRSAWTEYVKVSHLNPSMLSLTIATALWICDIFEDNLVMNQVSAIV